MMKKIIVLIILIALIAPISIFAAIDADSDGGAVELENPIGETNPNLIIGKVIEAALGIVGSLALLMFIYGGFIWMLAAGNNERVQKGKEVLIWATVGLVVIFSSYAMIKLIFQGLGI